MIEKQLDNDLYEYIIAFNCTINDTYTATVIDTLKPELINNTNIREYIKIIFDFYRKHSIVPTPTEIRAYLLTDELKESYKDVVKKFATLDTTYNFDELISNTESFIKERSIYDALKQTINEYSVHNKIEKPAEVLQLFESACNINLVDNLGFDYLNRIDDHVRDIKIIDKFIPTGYNWLDGMLGGGWLEGGRALYLFMGGTNVGKSIVLGNIATKLIEQGRTVVLITLEMPEPVYCKRISAQLSRIPFNKLRAESDMLTGFLTNFYKGHPTSRLIVKEFPPSSVSPNHIKAYMKKLTTKLKIKPDVVVLDYLTLLLAANPTGSLYADGKSIAEHVRALSYPAFLGCPIISAGQINRAGMGEQNPDMDKTGESIAIPQTADGLFTLWQTDAEKELGLLNMGVKKNRFGPNFGKTAFKIDYDTLSIDEIENVFTDTDNIKRTNNLLEKLGNS